MKHRDNTAVIDGPSRAKTTGPKHRLPLGSWEITLSLQEEMAYIQWCRKRLLDPTDSQSMVAYEGDVGWLFIDDPEDHR